MPPASVSAESRELLGGVRNLLLEQHKCLLDRERALYERQHGPIAGPGPMLMLVIESPVFAWLKNISGLIVDIDEALAPRAKTGQEEADMLVLRARQLIAPREHGTDFQAHYYEAIRESPDTVLLQCRLEKLLGIE